jgi:hypothetical protein
LAKQHRYDTHTVNADLDSSAETIIAAHANTARWNSRPNLVLLGIIS